jgi:hypothetical protein
VFEQKQTATQVASKTAKNRSYDKVTLIPQNGPFRLAKSLQPNYNPKKPYLPVLKTLYEKNYRARLVFKDSAKKEGLVIFSSRQPIYYIRRFFSFGLLC